VGGAARLPAREGAVSLALSACSSFANPLSKLQNSKKVSTNLKSPKTKVVEEIYTYNFAKGRHMF
jgi:hypothetical protein